MTKKDLVDLIRGSKFEYAYDKDRKIYSVKVFLNKEPRILTMIVGGTYLEYSLSDEGGNVLEVLRQEAGNLQVTDYKKK